MENMSSVEFEVPLSVSSQAIWGGVMFPSSKRCPFPELVPEVYASVEGHWIQVGSVLRIKFNNGMRDCNWTYTAIDSDARSITLTWVEQEGPMAMRSHVLSGMCVGTGEVSCSIHYSMHFDGEVSADYAQALKETITQTMVLFSFRLTSTAQTK